MAQISTDLKIFAKIPIWTQAQISNIAISHGSWKVGFCTAWARANSVASRQRANFAANQLAVNALSAMA